MASSGGAFSQTLQDITNTKLEELAKKRTLFEQRKASSLQDAERQERSLDTLEKLAEGCKQCFGISTSEGKVVRGSSSHPDLENDLRNLQRIINQARFDPSVSQRIVEQWRAKLLRYLDVQSLKYQYADLYGKLTVEWLQSSAPQVKSKSIDQLGDTDEFERVSVKAKLQAKQNWEHDVFEDHDVNETAINEYLTRLFDSKGSDAALNRIRTSISTVESGLSTPNQFNTATLHWTLKSLLASDRLTNEKRQVIRDFQSNNVILTEIADVLNMRLAAVDNWSWGSGVPVEARRQLNGKYNIHMDEDLLQSIFLQYIGMQWSTQMKQALTRFQEDHDAWTYGLRRLTPLEQQRRRWFLSSSPTGQTVEQVRNWTYRYGFFLSQLKDNVYQGCEIEEGAEEANYANYSLAAAVVGARSTRFDSSVQMKRRTAADNDVHDIEMKEESDDDMGFGLFDGDPPGPDLDKYKPKNFMDAKQRLLHLLSTEILTRTSLYGGITCFRSQFDSLKSLLPHATIRAVLRFFGVSAKWLAFFETFLQAPLKFANEDDKPRTRRRGTPSSNVVSDFFSEILLFCLDYQINKSTDGELLWRTDDDFWFWSSSHKTCVEAWETIRNFVEVMGLGLDKSKSASAEMILKNGSITKAHSNSNLPRAEIRWGMIVLDETTGHFTIDQRLVDKHVEELRRQLKDKERSLFAWVQAYSTYASVFFTTNFGKPAHCFGREHLDSILSMHERVQTTLFSGQDNADIKSVVDWLKAQIEQRFGVKNVPDGYLFFPTSLGGLEVKSPFISPLQLRESIVKDPKAYFQEYLEAEREHYEKAKKSYLERKPWEFVRRNDSYRPDDPTQFMPFEEYVKFREQLNYGYPHQLVDTYKHLLQEPEEQPLENDGSTIIREALTQIPQDSTTIKAWSTMDSYWKWVTMLYGPEMLNIFDGFQIVDTGLLPMGMVSIFRSGKVSWQE